MKKHLPLYILGGMVTGFGIGLLLQQTIGPQAIQDHVIYEALDGIAKLFLNLLKMVVVPLVLFSLLQGMLGMGDLGRLGRLGRKTFGYYILTSSLAVVTGLVLVNLIGPGVGAQVDLAFDGVDKPMPSTVWDVLLNMIPSNVLQAAAESQLFGVIFFAILFGAFLLQVEAQRRQALVDVIEASADVMMRMTQWVISLAPIGIGALIARLIATIDLTVLGRLVGYALTVLAALGVHALLVVPALVWLRTRRNPYAFMRQMLPAYITALSTASSSGTLGVTMERAEQHAGISKRVTSFVLPLGATVNMDGTALYEIVTVLFIAQLHAGIDPSFSLSLTQQLLVVALGLAVSIGAAGIPHAGLVMMVIILQAVGLPVEYTGLIWLIDRPLDMCRTAVNVAGDAAVTLMIAHGEGDVRPV